MTKTSAVVVIAMTKVIEKREAGDAQPVRRSLSGALRPEGAVVVDR